MDWVVVRVMLDETMVEHDVAQMVEVVLPIVVDAEEVWLDLLLWVEDGVYHEVLAGTVYVSQDVVEYTDSDGVAAHFGQS